MNVTYEILVSGINQKPPIGSFGYASVVLISTGREKILFDTGSYGLRGFLKEKLKKVEITAVVLSHLHFDHCSNIDMFPGVPVHLSKTELSYFEAPTSEDDADMYQPFKILRKRVSLHIFDSDNEIAPGVKLVHTPGHTAGHCSLEVLTETGPVLMAGDAVKSSLDWSQEQETGNSHMPHVHINTKKWIKSKYDIIVSGHEGELRQGIPLYSASLRRF